MNKKWNEQIQELDQYAMDISKKKWDSIAKPLHSLGKLEDNLIQIAGMTRSAAIDVRKKALVIMCADNGVVEEGVTQSGQEVTALVAENFLSCQATAAILCRQTGADVIPVDIGMVTDTKVVNRKIAYGTKNLAKEPAMTREEAIRALETGISMVQELAEQGYKVIATGEMGIGNTTTSSALAAVFLNRDVEEMTGRGAGLSSKGLEKKIQVIRDAIALHQPGFHDAIDVLACLGGFDIAGMAGLFIGGAICRIPVVLDGFISSVAALTAVQICPACRNYMLASHVSKEPAAQLVLDALKLEAPLHCDMCLGEGSGAVMLFPILDMASNIYEKMSTFDDISLDAYQPLS